MAQLKGKEYRNLLELWNRKEWKLTLLVVEAGGLTVGPTEAPSAFVKVYIGRSSSALSTKIVRQTSEPVFREFFFHTVNDVQLCQTVLFEVYSARIGKDRFLGQASIDVFRLQPEGLHDFWLSLVPKPDNGRRSSISMLSLRASASSECVAGRLRVRALLSCLSGSRPRAGPLVQSYDYDYETAGFKTGDVLVFSGVGMLPTLTKLLSNSEYSALGVVVILPNLYTQRSELYIAEVTPNHDGMIDAFMERPKKAVCIFRLHERLHQFHGGNIKLYPLKSEVRLEAAEKMMAWVWQVHSKGGLPLDLAGGQVQFIKKELGFKLERPEIQAELSELSSSLFVLRCLTLCEQAADDTPAQLGGLPSFVLQLPCFGEPRQVRTWLPQNATALSQQPYPLGAQQQQQQQSPRLDASGSPRSPSLHTTTLKKAVSPHMVAAAAAAATVVADEPLPMRLPPPMQRQASSLMFRPSQEVLPEESDCLTIDVASLINDLRAVSLDNAPEAQRNNNGSDNSNDEEEEHDEEDRRPESDSSSSPKSWGVGRQPVTPAAVHVAPGSPIVRERLVEEPIFEEPTLSDLNVENLDMRLLEPPPTTLVLEIPTLDPHSDTILNLVNYLPGMELVRFSEGVLSIDDASALIRYKHENLGGLFWSFADLQVAVMSLGLSMRLLEAFTKPPFPPKLLSLLAPQVATRVRCEPLFDGSAIFAHMMDVVSAAQSYVHLSLPELSHLGLIAALSLAGSRGVQVRVLVCTDGAPPVIPNCRVVAFRPSSFLSMWTPELRQQLRAAGVPEEFLQLQDTSRRSLQKHSFAVRARRAMMVVDGRRSVVGSFSAVANTVHDAAVAVEGVSAARLMCRAFASLWMCVGGDVYDWSSPVFFPAVADREQAGDDDVALYLSFPGNPCQVMQKHVLESLAFGKGPMVILAPHFTEPALHGQLKGLSKARLRQIRVVSSCSADTLSGRLLRSHAGVPVANGLALFDYAGVTPRVQHCSVVMSGGCIFCGSYGFTHRPDFDAQVLVRSKGKFTERVTQQIMTDIASSRLLKASDMVPHPNLEVTQTDFFE